MTTTTSHQPDPIVGAATLPALDLRGLTKTFGDVTAVRGLDLSVRSGEIVAFLGPNGAGKTTTLDMALGLATPDEGTAEVFGMPPREAVERGLVAVVMQSGGLLKDLRVEETVELTASLFARSRPVAEVLERAGIADLATRRVGQCSGGEQQRLRFAMALVSDPALVMLDEPTTGMDVAGRREFWSAIRDDAARGRTVLFATHYLEEADQYADRVVLVRDGRVVADGTAAQIKAQASGRTVRATLPGADVDALSGAPYVDQIDLRGETVLLHTRWSDDLARWLLTETEAHDVEITAHGLEDAFLTLTTEGADR